EDVLFGVKCSSDKTLRTILQILNRILYNCKYHVEPFEPPTATSLNMVGLDLNRLIKSHIVFYRTLTIPLIYDVNRALWLSGIVLDITDVIIESIKHKVEFATKAYKFLLDLQDLLLNFRYVQEGDWVLQSDHNLFVDFSNIFLNFAKQITEDLFKEDIEVNDKLSELEEVVKGLSKVKGLEVILPEHHNSIVDAIFKMREFVSLIRKKLGLSY
ncbi:MAG: hypothetical protein ACXQTI_06575, partial [Candidatus Nezhaarchaeales archaeon]